MKIAIIIIGALVVGLIVFNVTHRLPSCWPACCWPAIPTNGEMKWD